MPNPDLTRLAAAPTDDRRDAVPAAQELRWIAAAALVYLLFALAWGALLRPNDGPDELDHVAMVEFMTREGRVPVLGRDMHAHLMDRTTKRRIEMGAPDPVTGIRDVRLPGVGDPEIRLPYASLPGAGYLPAVATARVARAFGVESTEGPARIASALVGALTVLVIGLTARTAIRGRAGLAAIAAWFVTCLPQFVFVGAYTNPDVTTALAAALVAWRTAEGAVRGWTLGRSVALGAAAGLVLLCKFNAYPVVPLAGLVFLATARGGTQRVLIRLACVVGTAGALAAPWFLHNAAVYGDLLGLQPGAAEVQRLLASLPQPVLDALRASEGWKTAGARGEGLFDLLFGKWMARFVSSFFGTFGWMSRRLALWQYAGYAACLCAAAVGWLVAVRAGALAGLRRPEARAQLSLALAGALSVAVIVALSVWQSLNGDYQPQGRYLFPALPAISIALAWGWTSAAGARRAAWIVPVIAGLLAVLLITATPRAIG